MEGLNEHEDQPDAATEEMPSDLDYAAATAAAAAVVAAAAAANTARDNTMVVQRGLVPTARRDDVQRQLCSVLVVPCDLSRPYAAPVVIGSQEESNIHAVMERHLKREYLAGSEKFWKLVRTELGLETWRPRVQGAQLKALQGARLPELEHEFQALKRVLDGMADCLTPDSSPELALQDFRTTVGKIQYWWRNRNQRPDGGYKRPGGPAPAGYQQAAKRRALSLAPLLGQHLLGYGEAALDQQDPLSDPAAAAALQAAAAAAATAGFMDLNAGDIAGGFQLPYNVNGLDQPAVSGPDAGGMSGGTAAAAAAAAAAATGMNGIAGSGSNPLSPFLANPSGLLVLDVGGKIFRTSLNTLLAVQGSLFWQVCYGQSSPGVIQRLPSGEVFIDRNGDIFSYILEYLRACACQDITFPMPNDARELQALAREAFFYQLTDLLGHIQHTAIMPHPSSRVLYDMAYLETGYMPMEGDEAMHRMECAKRLVMQQLNHIIHQRAEEGFAVQEVSPGTAHRTDDAGNTHHNLYYNVLLQKVVPLLPEDMAVPDEADEDQQEDLDEDEVQQQSQQQQQQQSQQSQQRHGRQLQQQLHQEQQQQQQQRQQ